jgi:hypothetical protein
MSTDVEAISTRHMQVASEGAVRFLSGLMIGLLALAGTACSDSTAPAPPVSVDVSVVKVYPPVLAETEEGFPTIACDVELHAKVAGDVGVTWTDATVRWYAGIERSMPLDSTTLSAAQVRASWGADGISAGQTLRARWTLTAGAPFSASVDFHFKSASGDANSTNFQFACGDVVPAGTPAPTITDISVASAPDKLEPLDTLNLSYSATSAGGLWQTLVHLSGPCDVQRSFAEHLQPEATHSVSMPIPSACQLGVPLQVTVATVDGGLQVGSRSLSTGIKLVDETPPALEATFFSSSGSGDVDLSGIFFGGDSIQVNYSASDNHELNELHWNVLPAGAGVDGSLPVSGSAAAPTIFVPLKETFSGTVQLRVSASDAVGLSSNVITTSAGTTRVYPSLRFPYDSTVDALEAFDMIADARRDVAYLLQPSERRIQVLSLSTMQVSGTISLPSRPGEFDISSGGDSLVVLLPGNYALGIVDLRASSWQTSVVPITAIDHSVEQTRWHLSTLSNGKVFVSAMTSASGSDQLIEVDLATGAQRVRTDAGENGYIHFSTMARSLDHSVVVLNGAMTYFQRYDASTDHFSARKVANTPYLTPVLDAIGAHVVIGDELYDASLDYVRKITSPVPSVQDTTHLVLSPDGAVLYQLLGRRGVVRVRVSDGALLDRIIDPIGANYMRLSDDGTLLLTTWGEGSYPNRVSSITLP